MPETLSEPQVTAAAAVLETGKSFDESAARVLVCVLEKGNNTLDRRPTWLHGVSSQ
jgi:hypothetical protein